MALSRSTAITVAALRARARIYLGDRDTTPAGSTIPAGFRRWSDTEIDEQINNALLWMGTEMQLQHQGEALVYATLTYSEPAARDGMDLPAGVDASAIYLVEDYTNDFVETVRYVSLEELKTFDRDVTTYGEGYRYVYTLIDRSATHGIMVRPIPNTARTLRIWYAATPILASASSDTPALSSQWKDLIAKKAAAALLASEGETPGVDFAAMLADDVRQFRSFCARRRGPVRIKLAPRGLY